jgi:phospholipid/cholesterol/gamma-HCH transport system substrate-binding protein
VSRRLQSEFVDSGGMRDMRQAINRTNALVSQLASIAAAQNRQVSALENQVQGMLASIDTRKLDSTLNNARTASANAAAISDSLRATTAQINALLTKVNSNQGTVGKLLSDSLLYADIRRLVTRVDSLTLDFKNNPGKYTKGVVRIF